MIAISSGRLTLCMSVYKECFWVCVISTSLLTKPNQLLTSLITTQPISNWSRTKIKVIAWVIPLFLSRRENEFLLPLQKEKKRKKMNAWWQVSKKEMGSRWVLRNQNGTDGQWGRRGTVSGLAFPYSIPRDSLYSPWHACITRQIGGLRGGAEGAAAPFISFTSRTF